MTALVKPGDPVDTGQETGDPVRVIAPESEIVPAGSGSGLVATGAEAIGAETTVEAHEPTSVGRQVAIAICLLGVIVIGFAGYLYGLSGLSEQRAQARLRGEFAYQLGQAIAPISAVSTPLGAVSPGSPVAAISIPRLGLSQTIVVSGTSARDLANGPGLRRDTVLPGQSGVSVIYGRRMTFGGPFGDLMRLQVGDVITATTAQGVSKYRVSSFGDADNPAPANSANRLVLATSDASFVPHESISVSADLITDPQPTPGVGTTGADEQSMSNGFAASVLPALLWSQALLLVAVAAPVAARRWKPLATYVCAVPLILAILWNLYENVACMLPNLY